MAGSRTRGILVQMNVLVAGASKHGATREIAEAIGRELEARGLAVEVSAVDDVRDLTDFDACVLGSAVYVGHRNWDAIAMWAGEIAAALSNPTDSDNE